MLASLRSKCFPAAVVFFLTSAAALAQDAPTFSSEVRVVNVLATVRDNKGSIVTSLTKDDFVLEEDGTAETIRYFSRVTDAPFTLGLLVDTSMSMLQELDNEKSASGTFANSV